MGCEKEEDQQSPNGHHALTSVGSKKHISPNSDDKFMGMEEEFSKSMKDLEYQLRLLKD